MTEAQTYDACLEKMAELVERATLARKKLQEAGFPAHMLELADKIVTEAETAMKYLVAQRLKVI